ncbi:MAG TPA: DUF502 domain-containing protein [Candidatus Saccharimonadia bacterium]|nr:DUF502 domain-containing protein [Candidatus Saccharimonadia bacterium]
MATPRPVPLLRRLRSLRLKRYFLTGVLTLLPIWLTWVVFKFVFMLLSGISKPWIAVAFDPIAQRFPMMLGWLAADWLQSMLALIATLLFIYGVGWATNRVVGQRLIESIELLIERIPLVKTIYGGTKKLLDLMQTKPEGVQRVVLIEFPHRGMRAVGLVTRTLRDERTGAQFAAVYVPTTPNPTSGYLEIVPLDRVTPTDWTMDQAMAFIISGGAISPDTVRYDELPDLPAVPPAPEAPSG